MFDSALLRESKNQKDAENGLDLALQNQAISSQLDGQVPEMQNLE